MTKETAASYKLDFKYLFKDGPLKDKKYTIMDFCRRNRYWENKSSFDYAVLEALNIPNPPNNIPLDIKQQWAIVDASPMMAEAEIAFQKWLKRREPVVNAWNDYVEFQNNPQTHSYYKERDIPAINSPATLMNIANVARRDKFRSFLETSRPYDMPISSIVELEERYINNYRYDPFYWGEHRTKPRVGTIVKYTDDTSGKSGLRSRYIQVMFFADGSTKNVPERCLRLHVPSSSVKE